MAESLVQGFILILLVAAILLIPYVFDLYWRRMNWIVRISGMALALFYFLAIFAPVIAPYDFDTQFRQFPNAPPTKVYWYGTPYVFKYELVNAESREYREVKDRAYFVRLFTGNGKFFGVEDGEVPFFLFGSDQFGRDIFSRLLYGSRISLSIGIAGVLVSFPLGLLIGAAAGYYGGRFDLLAQRVFEIFMSIPALPFLIVLSNVIPPGVGPGITFFLIAMILAFTLGWSGLAMTVRGMTFQVREAEFVEAARSIGASDFRVITRHIIPQIMHYAIVSASLTIPGFILGESALSFIGLGVQEPHSSWGNMLSAALANIQLLELQPWILIPGIAIFIVVLCCNFFGDFLRDMYDPRSKRRA